MAKSDAGQLLYDEAKRLIPGGTMLLSKRPEMYAPGQWPPYYRHSALHSNKEALR